MRGAVVNAWVCAALAILTGWASILILRQAYGELRVMRAFGAALAAIAAALGLAGAGVFAYIAYVMWAGRPL